MKIQDLRSFLAKALVKISCKTQSAQHNKQTKCEYMKGDLRHLFGHLTVSNLLASVQVQFAYKDHFWFAHKGWLVWPCFHQPACKSIYITSDRQAGSTTSSRLKEIACFFAITIHFCAFVTLSSGLCPPSTAPCYPPPPWPLMPCRIWPISPRPFPSFFYFQSPMVGIISLD